MPCARRVQFIGLVEILLLLIVAGTPLRAEEIPGVSKMAPLELLSGVNQVVMVGGSNFVPDATQVTVDGAPLIDVVALSETCIMGTVISTVLTPGLLSPRGLFARLILAIAAWEFWRDAGGPPSPLRPPLAAPQPFALGR